MGLVVFGAMFLYLLIAIVVVVLAIGHAWKNEKSVTRWGLGTALIMYLIPFWDWIPTVVAQNYYCSTYGGLTINKTIEEWKKENPGVAETLVQVKGVKSINTKERTRHELNQRFSEEYLQVKHFLGIREKSKHVIDKMTGEAIASYVDFDTDIRAIALGPRNLRDFKFWQKIERCKSDISESVTFNGFVQNVENLGDK